jgi:rhamnose utilization protein RhaD (predicted bifunctional aldolase and dehydrogenase)
MARRTIGLEALRDISARLGADSKSIQATGGNTSLKEDGILWVKASGKNLARARIEEIFLPIDLEDTRRQLRNMKANYEESLTPMNRAGMRPSIETTLHALMPHNVVLHSHQIDVISITLSPEAQTYLGDALGSLKWHWIDYCRPGAELTKAIGNALERGPADILILANHGLVVGGMSAEDAFSLHEHVSSRLRQSRRDSPAIDIRLLQPWLEQIPKSRLPKSEIIHTLATDNYSFELSTQNPPYPDHVVFCGIRPWVISGNHTKPEAGIAYGIIPRIGVVMLEDGTDVTEEMLEAQAEIYLRIPKGRKVNLLSDDQCLDLVNWEAEKYRKELSKGK